MNILCVCYGNTCRSPMLEGLLKKACAARPNIHIESAGLLKDDDQPAHEHAIACMDERGVDIRPHRSRHVGTIDLRNFDLIVCVEPSQKEVIQALCPAARVILGNEPNGIENPWEKGLEAYRSCAATIEKVVADLATRLLA